MLSYQDYYDCCENVRQHSQFERYLSEIVLDKQQREQFYDKLHEKLVDSSSPKGELIWIKNLTKKLEKLYQNI